MRVQGCFDAGKVRAYTRHNELERLLLFNNGTKAAAQPEFSSVKPQSKHWYKKIRVFAHLCASDVFNVWMVAAFV